MFLDDKQNIVLDPWTFAKTLSRSLNSAFESI